MKDILSIGVTGLTVLTILTTLSMIPVSTGASEGQEWGYEGDKGPEYWGDLEEGFDICKRGRNQSPIDLEAQADTDLPKLIFEYTNPGRLKETNTGHTLMEEVNPGNYLWLLEERFELKQFHFHSPSEHLVGGKAYAMEIHMVHQNEVGDLAVIALLFEEGAHNETMDQLPSFRAKRGKDPYAGDLDYNDLFPNRQEYFYYNGSLTTPPCTEGVAWVILKEPIVASPEQIQHFHDIVGFDNNRPIQPRHARIVID